MKLFTGWVLAAGLIFCGRDAPMRRFRRLTGLAGRRALRGVSDVGGAYAAMPPEARLWLRPAALLPPTEVYTVMRDNGFSPLGIPQRRGHIYTIAVIDRGGGDGRLVIDARDGRIVRFVPACRNGGDFEAMLAAYLWPARPVAAGRRPRRAAATGVGPACRKPQRAGAEAEPAACQAGRPAGAATGARCSRSQPTRSAAVPPAEAPAIVQAQARCAAPFSRPGNAAGAGAGVTFVILRDAGIMPKRAGASVPLSSSQSHPRNDGKQKTPRFPGAFSYSANICRKSRQLTRRPSRPSRRRPAEPRCLRRIGMLRGFLASGISRTRSTWSRPFSSEAFFTWTKSANWKARSKARAAMPR